MSPKQAYSAYNQALYTIPKTRQVVMLYDGIIRYLQQAREAMEAKRIQDRFNLLVKAGEIVMGLQSSLDFEKGESVAQVLYDFYSSVDARILTLHRTQDLVMCDGLIQEIKEMRAIWDEIDKANNAGSNAPAEASAATAEPEKMLEEAAAARTIFPSDLTA